MNSKEKTKKRETILSLLYLSLSDSKYFCQVPPETLQQPSGAGHLFFCELLWASCTIKPKTILKYL